MSRIWIPLVCCLAIAGCSTVLEPPMPAVPSAEEDTCNGSQYANLVGQPESALERVLILREVRIIRPGMMVTMDHRPTRLNFVIGESRNIERIYCG